MKFLIIESCGDGCDSLYTGEADEDNVALNYEGDGWTIQCRNTEAISLKDDGDGVTIHFDKRKVKLDYAQLSLMRLVLQMYNTEQNFVHKFKKYQLVEETQ